MLIKWVNKSEPHDESDVFLEGIVGRKVKYLVANKILSDSDIIIADVCIRDGVFLDIDIVVASAEDGMQLCEMWEATGAYLVGMPWSRYCF